MSEKIDKPAYKPILTFQLHNDYNSFSSALSKSKNESKQTPQLHFFNGNMFVRPLKSITFMALYTRSKMFMCPLCQFHWFFS